ncbi:MAG: flagellar basal body P-ring formation chaperone FlgA [Betaproteobacteria bacterium]
MRNGSGLDRREVRRLVAAVGLLVALLTCAPALALTVELGTEARVAGTQIRLGDVARIVGDQSEQAQVATLTGLVLGQAPRPGQVRTLTRGQVVVRLRQAGLDPEEVEFTGSESVAVRQPGRLLGREEAEGLYRREIARLLAVEEDRVALSLVNWTEPVVPEGELGFRVRGGVAQVARAVATGTLTGPVDLTVNGEAQATLRPRAVISVRVPAVVTREGLARGSVIRPGQVDVVEVELARLPDGALRTLEEAEGKQVARSVPTGTPLSRTDVMVPVVIRRGDRVTLCAETGGLILTAQGLALEEGGIGEVIKVQNAQSNRTVEGVVRGAGQVLVNLDGPPAGGL